LEGPEFMHRWPRGVKFAVGAVATYLVGALFSLVLGVLSAYIASFAFVLGSVGVAWVVTSVAARTRRIDQLYMTALPAFGSSQLAASLHIEKMFVRICSYKLHLLVSAMVMTVLSTALVFAFFVYPFAIFDIEITSLRPIWFSPELYTHAEGLPGFAVVGLFAALISISMGTSLCLMFGELKILTYLNTLPVPPLPEALRVALVPLADFHVQVARDWSLGALLFVFLFLFNADAVSLGLVAMITFVAACVFVLPQIKLRSMVVRAHRRAVETVLFSWNQSEPIQQNVGKDPTFLAELVTISTPPRYWVYGSGQLLTWMIAQSTAMAALVIQITEWASGAGV
jgi:hypothetical protein